MKKSHMKMPKYSRFGSKKPTFSQRITSESSELKNEALQAMMNVKSEVNRVAKNIASLFQDKVKAHGWLWNFRTNRIRPPNYASHITSMVTLVLASMQICLLLFYIRVTGGHIGNIKNFSIIMMPAYVALGLNLFFRFIILCVVVSLTTKEMHRHPFARLELTRIIPILEHVVVVVAHSLFLLTVYAIGSCHINFSTETEPQGFCKSFSLSTVTTIMGMMIAVKLLHHFISIYNHHCHTSNPNNRAYTSKGGERSVRGREEMMVGGDDTDDGDGVLDTLYGIDQSFMEGWQFWEVRMNRIMSANVADNLCKCWGITFLGIFIIRLITEVHNSHGMMGNITDMPSQTWPLYVMFFGKAAIQAAILGYVYFNHFPDEKKLDFVQWIRDHPSQGWKVLEHFLPVITNSFFGILTMAVGQCHLNPTLDKGQGICQVFPYKVVMGVLMVIGMIQIVHHLLSLWHFHRHCYAPESHPGDDSFDLKVNRSTKSTIAGGSRNIM